MQAENKEQLLTSPSEESDESSSDEEYETGYDCEYCGAGNRYFMVRNVLMHRHIFKCSVCEGDKFEIHILCTNCIQIVESKVNTQYSKCRDCLSNEKDSL